MVTSPGVARVSCAGWGHCHHSVLCLFFTYLASSPDSVLLSPGSVPVNCTGMVRQPWAGLQHPQGVDLILQGSPCLLSEYLSFSESNFYDLASPSYKPVGETPIIYASQTFCLRSKILFEAPTQIWMNRKPSSIFFFALEHNKPGMDIFRCLGV